jgi:hypothetical protein
MTARAVKLIVIASIPKDCSFWLEDDGWKGVCEELSLTVRGSSFATKPRGDIRTRVFSAGHHDLFVVLPVRSAASWLLPVIQTRPADLQRHHLSRLGVNRTAAHSPTTFKNFDLQGLPPQRSFRLPDAMVLLGFRRSRASPPSAAFAPCSASSFQR